jgi:hypothetical protein
LIAGRGLLDTAVIDENVQCAEHLQGGGEHVLDVLFVGDIGFHGEGLDRLAGGFGGSFRFCGDGLCAIGTALVIDGDIAALLGKANGDGLADTGRSAGDQYVLTYKSGLHF